MEAALWRGAGQAGIQQPRPFASSMLCTLDSQPQLTAASHVHGCAPIALTR